MEESKKIAGRSRFIYFYLMKKFFVFFLFALYFQILPAQNATDFQPAAQQKQNSFLQDSIDQYIESGLKDWNLPGLAVVIVKDGKVVLMKGYGVRDIQTQSAGGQQYTVHDRQQYQTVYGEFAGIAGNRRQHFRWMIISLNISQTTVCTIRQLQNWSASVTCSVTASEPKPSRAILLSGTHLSVVGKL